MIKLIGAVIVIGISIFIGYALTNTIKQRIINITVLSDFVDSMSEQVSLYKTPLDEIYLSASVKYQGLNEFHSNIREHDGNVFYAALQSGVLLGDEEKEIIRSFGDRIGSGTAEDVVKLCSFTSVKLKNLKDRLSSELPDKKRIYNTISLLVGASAVILLI